MSQLPTLYLAPAHWQEPFILRGEEAHHLRRVLRAQKGQKVRLFDGCGHSGLFCITALAAQAITLDKLSIQIDPPPPYPLTLAMGWSKNARRGLLLEKAVELGATAIWFWPADRSQGKIPPTLKDSWPRQLVAAAKQCEITWLPQLRILPSLAALLAAGPKFGSRVLCWEEEKIQTIHPQDLTHAQGTLAVLGPEGGLTRAEVDQFAAHGFQIKSLGPNVLRCETAAFFVLSLRLWRSLKTQP